MTFILSLNTPHVTQLSLTTYYFPNIDSYFQYLQSKGFLGNAAFEALVMLFKFCVKAKPTSVGRRVYQVSLIIVVYLYKQYYIL